MTAIIFGINGQDGIYLNTLLENLGYTVIGVSRKNQKYLEGDVADYNFVEEIIKANKPKFIFHLASNSTVRHEALFENHASIETGALNILECCFKYSKQSRIFLSGSAVQFLNIGDPIDEHTPFAPISPYAVSRIASVYAGRYYRSLQLMVYIGYFFNHDSPFRTERHINKKITSVVQRIAAGSSEFLEIGDLNVKKEFNYADDMMHAIWALVNQDKYFEAVIGSGKAYSIKDWVKACFDFVGKDWNNFVREVPGFKSEYQILVSNPRLIHSLGWKPEVNFYQLVDKMMKA